MICVNSPSWPGAYTSGAVAPGWLLTGFCDNGTSGLLAPGLDTTGTTRGPASLTERVQPKRNGVARSGTPPPCGRRLRTQAPRTVHSSRDADAHHPMGMGRTHYLRLVCHVTQPPPPVRAAWPVRDELGDAAGHVRAVARNSARAGWDTWAEISYAFTDLHAAAVEAYPGQILPGHLPVSHATSASTGGGWPRRCGQIHRPPTSRSCRPRPA